MKITNKFKLPESIIQAVSGERKIKENVFSVTEILNSPKQIWLKRKYNDQIEVDASSRLWALFGSAIHYVIDQAEDKGALKEEGLKAKFGEVLLTGRPDYFDGKTLIDFKMTSVWTIVHGSQDKKWEEQLNCYAYLYSKVGFDVKELQIIALLKDWSASKAKKDDYPDVQCIVKPIELWTESKQENFIKNRLNIIKAYETVNVDEIPACQPEDRWRSETIYAVMKEKRKSAVRLFDKENEAYKFLEGKDSNHSIQIRQGIDKRCVDYCEASEFCSYYREHYGNK